MSNLNNILDELYAIDPALKSNPDVPKIVASLLAARPVVAIDEAFRMQLRQRLLKQSEPVRTARPVSMFKRPWLYAVPVAVIAAIFIFPKLREAVKTPSGSTPGSTVTVQSTGDQAFGVLSASTLTAESTKARNSSGTAADTQTASPTVSPTSIFKPDMQTYYKYVYTGAPLQLNDSELAVLERQAGTQSAATAGLLDAAGLGTVNLRTFGTLNVQNITLSQPDGFTLNISQPDGIISMYRVQSSYIRPLAQETKPLPDREVIKIATDFLADHGINASLYGQPKVQSSYAIPAIGRAVLEGDVSVKDSIGYFPTTQVVFPVVIDGVASFGLWGDPIGMTVDVDAATRQVISVYNLTSRRYVSSAYPAVTDAATILQVADRGGVYGAVYPAETKTTEVKLGAPERILAQMYRYDTTSRELLVPALRFPVIDRTDFMPTAIVVPLIKDLLAVDTPVIEPMIIDGSGANSSSGSSSGSEPALVNGTSPDRD